MNWIESILYGLVSGIAEFLPISSSAHQQILLKLFGFSNPDPIQNLFVHLALILAVFTAGSGMIENLRRLQQYKIHNYHRGRSSTGALELRFLKNAILPHCVLTLILFYVVKLQYNLFWIAVFSLFNGIVVFLQSRLMRGNKDEQLMSILDSTMVGAAGSLSVFSGISRIGTMLTTLTARGVDKQKSVNWVILFSIPALILLCFLDILNILSSTGSMQIYGNFFGYILSFVCSYFAGYFGILLLKRLADHANYIGFAYYSWGVSMFSFILYLTVV